MTRAAHLRTLTRQEREVNGLRREFTRRLRDLLDDALRDRDQFDVVAYVRTMRQVDRLLDEFYGRFPGDDRSRFLTVLLGDVEWTTRYAFAEEAARAREMGVDEGLVES